MEGIGSVLKNFQSAGGNTKLHSEAHVLADEMCRYFAEPTSGPGNRFGTYLGVVKRLGIARARAAFASMKSDVNNARNPRKLFMWLTGAPKDPLAPKTPKAPRRPVKKSVKSKTKNEIHASHTNPAQPKTPRKVHRGPAGRDNQARLPGLD
jgi:hypothetical protein